MNNKKTILALLVVLLSLPLVSGNEIIGDSVVQEDAFSKLTTYPHTVFCPGNIECIQNFDLKNKTGSTQNNIRIAYEMDLPLLSGKLELWINPTTKIISKQRVCNFESTFELNKFPNQANKHEAICFTTNDNNTVGDTSDDFQEIIWVNEFKTGDQGTQTINYDVEVLDEKGHWVDKTSNISSASKNGNQYYYTNTGISLDSQETITWRIKYRPNKNAVGKWNLYYYQGSAGCILNDTCSYVNQLDPWFDSDSLFKKEITATGTGDNNLLRFDFNSSSFGPFEDFFASSTHDGNAIVFTDSTETIQLFHNLRQWTTDSNATIDVNTGTETTGTIFMYYGNDTNTSDQSRPNEVYTVWDDFDTGDYNTGTADWTGQTGNWTESGGLLTVFSGPGLISTDMGSSLSYSQGFLIEMSVITSCSSCHFGISNNDNAHEAVADADGYEMLLTQSTNRLRIDEYIDGTNSGATAQTLNFAWAFGDAITFTRDYLGGFRTHIRYDTNSILGVTDSTTTTGQFPYLAGSTGDQFEYFIYTNKFNRFATFSVGAQQVETIASFTTTGLRALDPEKGITSTTLTFTNTSFPSDANFTWFVDDVNLSSDTNFSHAFTSLGDFNVFLQMDSAGEVVTGQETITISQLVQNVDINFSFNTFTTLQADVNFGVTFDGNGDAFNWGFPQDSNITTRNAQKTYSSSGQKEVCVTITTTDANKTVCEDFIVGRVIVKIPLDISTLAELTPFDMTASANPPQSFSALSVDTNLFFFSDGAFSSNINIDFNSDYFPTSRVFDFTSVSNDFEFQPFLVTQTGNLASIIFTINNINQKQTIPGILIVSETVISGDLIIVESKESDITGTAEFHFEVGRTYTLSFFDSDGILIFSGQLDAKSVDTELFAALAERVLFVSPEPGGIVNISWIPVVGSVQPIDGNVTLTQLLTPFNTVIGDVNIFITHLNDTNVIFNRVFTLDSSAADQNITFDVNVSGFNDDFPLNVNLQIFDTNGVLIGFIQIKEYYFIESRIVPAFDALKTELGEFPVMFISVILATVALGLVTFFSPSTNNNWVGTIGVILTGFFVIISWIPIEAWLIATSMTIGMFLWRDREQ